MKKTIIKRNLPLNENYDFLGITDMGEMNYSVCANCGRPIRYIAELKNSKGVVSYVGTECVKTLIECKINNSFSMMDQINAMKKIATATNLINKGTDIKIWGYDDKTALYIVGKNSKGTVKKIFIEPLFDVFLQKSYSFIDALINDVFDNHTPILKEWCFYDIEKYMKSLKS